MRRNRPLASLAQHATRTRARGSDSVRFRHQNIVTVHTGGGFIISGNSYSPTAPDSSHPSFSTFSPLSPPRPVSCSSTWAATNLLTAACARK